MYPGQTEKFMKAFEKATKRQYGFLLVDLKPFTPDQERLKHEVTWPDECDYEAIKGSDNGQNYETIPDVI